MGGCASAVLYPADLVGEGLRIHTGRLIATGGFSQILLGKDCDSSDIYAIKRIVCNSKQHNEEIERECSLIRQLHSVDSVVDLIAVIQIDEQFNLVFPLFPRGTLACELERRKTEQEHLKENTIIELFTAICSGVEHIHKLAFAHRDVKTANILLTQEFQPKITDFGSAVSVPINVSSSSERQFWVDDCAEKCSMTYRAPELFVCLIGSVITDACDIWSLGCILFACCHFVSPFDLTYEKGNSVALAVQSPENIEYSGEKTRYTSQLFVLIKELLTVDPSKRPPAHLIRKKIRHLKRSGNNKDSAASGEVKFEVAFSNENSAAEGTDWPTQDV